MLHVRPLLLKLPAALLATLALNASLAVATEEYTLTIKDHAFDKQELVVPAGQKITLLVINKDATPAEFESKPLNREKVIPGNAQATLHIGPLRPGRYGFVEEYHEKEAAAQGTIIAQ